MIKKGVDKMELTVLILKIVAILSSASYIGYLLIKQDRKIKTDKERREIEDELKKIEAELQERINESEPT